MSHRLDAFGDDLDTERLSDFDDGRDESLLRQRRHDGRDQFSIDLQTSGRQLDEARDRRVARAKIIDFDVNAERLDFMYGLDKFDVMAIEGYRFQQFE